MHMSHMFDAPDLVHKLIRASVQVGVVGTGDLLLILITTNKLWVLQLTFTHQTRLLLHTQTQKTRGFTASIILIQKQNKKIVYNFSFFFCCFNFTQVTHSNTPSPPSMFLSHRVAQHQKVVDSSPDPSPLRETINK